VAVEKADHHLYYIEKLAVLPDCRHKGMGKMLVSHALDYIASKGGQKVSIGIIDEQTILKTWYRMLGFTETGTKKFPHLPFTVCFMEQNINRQVPDDS